MLDPIELSYGGSTASLTITNPVDSRWFTNQNYINIDETGNTVTLSGFLSTPGTYNGTITTNSIGGCDEIALNIQITVTDVGGTFGSGGEGTGTTTGGTNTGGNNSGGGNSNTTSSSTLDNNSTNTSLNNNTSETYSISVSAQNSSDYILIGNDRNGSINGNDPAVTLNIGDTINFDVDAPGHPFYLKTVAGTGTGNTINNASNNGTTNQIVSWTPDTTGTYFYQCSFHGGMVGRIIVQ